MASSRGGPQLDGFEPPDESFDLPDPFDCVFGLTPSKDICLSISSSVVSAMGARIVVATTMNSSSACNHGSAYLWITVCAAMFIHTDACTGGLLEATT